MSNVFANTSISILHYIETRARAARQRKRKALLYRELSQLPRYVAEDIGVGPRQDGFVNNFDS